MREGKRREIWTVKKTAPFVLSPLLSGKKKEENGKERRGGTYGCRRGKGNEKETKREMEMKVGVYVYVELCFLLVWLAAQLIMYLCIHMSIMYKLE